MDVDIRPAEPSDLEALAQLSQAVFRETFGAHYIWVQSAFDQYLQDAFSPAAFQKLITKSNYKVLVCDQQSQLVGYATLEFLPDLAEAEIQRFYLSSSVHGKGIAHRLMEHCLSLTQHPAYQTLKLGVWQQNHRAIRFYRKWGFSIAGYKSFLLGSILEYDYLMKRPINR